MTKAEILREMQSRLESLFDSEGAIKRVLVGILNETKIRWGACIADSWHNILEDLSKIPGAFKKLLRNTPDNYLRNSAFIELSEYIDAWNATPSATDAGVNVCKTCSLVPIPVLDHAKKSDVYAPVIADFANDSLMQLLLELGPAIDAHYTEVRLLAFVESLSELINKPIVKKESVFGEDDRITELSTLISMAIGDIRKLADESIELQDLRNCGQSSSYDPLLVMLKCKFCHLYDAPITPEAFISAVAEYESVVVKTPRSGAHSKRMKAAITKLGAVTAEILTILRRGVNGRFAHAREVIREFYGTPEPRVEGFLNEFRPKRRAGVPAPALWMKIEA